MPAESKIQRTAANGFPNEFRGLVVAAWLQASCKRPAIEKWSGYCDNLPKAAVQLSLVSEFSHLGIGVCLGREMRPGLRIGAMDLDDDQPVAVVRALFGDPLCAKRGKKGQTIFLLADKAIKSTTLKNSEEKHIADLLIGGKQTVIPPTIHPDTGRPYEWITAARMGFLQVFEASLKKGGKPRKAAADGAWEVVPLA